jgi:hypothetical protein
MTRDDYAAYLLTEEWRKKRKAAIHRAGGRCQECLVAGLLHVHHLTYERVGREWLDDLIVLCPWHHHCRHNGTPSCKRCGGPVLRGLDHVPEHCVECFAYLAVTEQ